jgi:hypothetical protein
MVDDCTHRSTGVLKKTRRRRRRRYGSKNDPSTNIIRGD